MRNFRHERFENINKIFKLIQANQPVTIVKIYIHTYIHRLTCIAYHHLFHVTKILLYLLERVYFEIIGNNFSLSNFSKRFSRNLQVRGKLLTNKLFSILNALIICLQTKNNLGDQKMRIRLRLIHITFPEKWKLISVLVNCECLIVKNFHGK